MSKGDRYQRQLLELVKQPGNDKCADCFAPNPRWASKSLGVFLCVPCASMHRKLGTHISQVKSLTLDTWTKDQVEFMKQNGNERVNALLNPSRQCPPTTTDDSDRGSQLERFIRAKYERKEFAKNDNDLRVNAASPQRARAQTIAEGSPESLKQVRFTGQHVNIDDEPLRLRSPSRSRSPTKSILRPRSQSDISSIPPPVPPKDPSPASSVVADKPNPFLAVPSAPPALLQPNHTGVQGGSLSSMRAMQEALERNRPSPSAPPQPRTPSPLPPPAMAASLDPPTNHQQAVSSPVPRRGFVPSSSFGQQLAAELAQGGSNGSSQRATPSPSVDHQQQQSSYDPYAALGALDTTIVPSPAAMVPQRTGSGTNPFLAMQQQQQYTGHVAHRAMSLPVSFEQQSHFYGNAMAGYPTVQQQHQAPSMMMAPQWTGYATTAYGNGNNMYMNGSQPQQQPIFANGTGANPFLRYMQ